MSKEQQKFTFKLLLALSIIAALVVSALLAFSFICIDELGMLTCLFVGVGMIALVVLTVLTVWRGLVAYRG